MHSNGNSIFYRTGKFIAREPLVSFVLLVTFVVMIWAFDFLSSPPQSAKTIQTAKVASESNSHNEALEKERVCKNEVENLIATAKQQLLKKEYIEAFATLDKCDGFFEAGSEADQFHRKVINLKVAAVEKEEAATAKREKARKKKEGVRIGMSEQDVIDSSWGKPAKINTTTRASGVRAQWVYGSGNYLYFEDGVLTSIQN